MGTVGEIDRGYMPTFSVMCYHSGFWGKAEPSIIEVRDAKEAAERACGGALFEGQPKPGLRRAKGWPASSPAIKEVFSDQPR
jgi:hypothetical protein